MTDLLLAFLRYDPLVRIHLGPLSISPHGLGIAVGFLLGASVFLRWCREEGLPDDTIYSLVNRAAVGSIIGARLAYVINHPGDFSSPLEIFAVWKGGISLLGGIAGATLAGVPKMRKEGLSFWKVMDIAVPCVAMGIVIGRIGDLVIADHLGKPTDFFLGYVCPTVETGSPCLAPPGEAVHQPALYDLFSASLLLVALLRLRTTKRYTGFLTCFFGAWYGAGRFIEDFFRVDDTHGTGLTGSQWTALVVMLLCLYVLVIKRDTPWRSGREPEDAQVLPEELRGVPEGPGARGVPEGPGARGVPEGPGARGVPERPDDETPAGEDEPGSMPAQPPATGDG